MNSTAEKNYQSSLAGTHQNMSDDMSRAATAGLDKAKEAATAVGDKAIEIGQQALDTADEYLRPVGLSIKENPMTTLAVVAGVAFSLGALWYRSSQSRSQMSRLFNEISSNLPRKWQ